MGSKPNNWREKRAEQLSTHRRKPGQGKYWKKRSNRFNRRKFNRVSKTTALLRS